jgi:alanyl-tRNA synthetase
VSTPFGRGYTLTALRAWETQLKTERLYYNDPYLLEFDANVIETQPVGERLGVILDRTAFYPTSGGQPNDMGTLNDVPVVDCIEDEASGSVIHVVGGRVSAGPVHCRIDRERRSDHMQQHSGQHVLSQAFVELFNWPTVSFHLGVSYCTIDLPVESVSREQANRAEDLANRIVQENRNVAVRYVAQEKVAEAGLRKPTECAGDIRVIDIAGYDRSACGGTHVRMTSEIGPILITGLERAKKQSRIQFICGNRVIRYARDANRCLESISQTISAPALETAGAVRTLWDEHQHTRKRVEELETELLDHEAAQFPVTDGVALASFKNRGIDKLKMLAVKICARPSTVALLADESDQLRVVFARSSDLSSDMSALLKNTIERFGGRGGGRPNLAQAGGLTAQTPDEVLKFARQQL